MLFFWRQIRQTRQCVLCQFSQILNPNPHRGADPSFPPRFSDGRQFSSLLPEAHPQGRTPLALACSILSFPLHHQLLFALALTIARFPISHGPRGCRPPACGPRAPGHGRERLYPARPRGRLDLAISNLAMVPTAEHRCVVCGTVPGHRSPRRSRAAAAAPPHRQGLCGRRSARPPRQLEPLCLGHQASARVEVAGCQAGGPRVTSPTSASSSSASTISAGARVGPATLLRA